MRFIDTHAHYTDERFENNFEGGADALIRTLFENNVEKIINVGVTVDNSIEVCKQAAKHAEMYAAVGIHPSDCVDIADENEEAELSRLCELLSKKDELKIVALGETGLDYYWDKDHHDKQKRFFHKQLQLAREFDLPVVVHDREAHGDSFETVIQYPDIRGVFHSYSGSPEMALELVKRGWYISLSGVVSFKNAPKVKEVASVVPRNRLLIETDAPYLTPHPFRGKTNRSDYLVYTLNAIAEARNEAPEDLSEAIYHNSLALFDKFF